MSKKELLEAFIPARNMVIQAIEKLVPMVPQLEAAFRRLNPEVAPYAHYINAQRRAQARAIDFRLDAEDNLAMDAVSRIDEVGEQLLAWFALDIKIRHAKREMEPFERELRPLRVPIRAMDAAHERYSKLVVEVKAMFGADSMFLRYTDEFLRWQEWAKQFKIKIKRTHPCM